MKKCLATVVFVLVLMQLAYAFSIDNAQASDIGPDIIVGDIQTVVRFDRVGDITAYGIGTNACNIGDERVDYVANTNQHPVIYQNMYRLKDGRFEQIGMSWGVHCFYAVSQSLCGPCLDPTDGSQLGVGCSDPFSGFLAGVQANMSKRSETNASTGYFPYPPPSSEDPWETSIDRRLQVQDSYLDPSLNTDALYFVEGHYISPDDAEAGNNDNNASYRQVTVTETSPNVYDIVVQSSTQRRQLALRAWQDIDPSVIETDIQTNEGLYVLSVKTTELGNGLWHYEYALQNLNSDRSAGSFSIPLPSGAIIQNIGFHDVDYHSGEDYDLSDWAATVTDSSITWTTESYADNPNANALRFDTLYNFWFDIYAPPDTTEATIGLFKPGTPKAVNAITVGPAQGVIINEIMQNPAAVFDGNGEWFELYNPSAQVIDINGWTIQDNDVDSQVIDNGGPLIIPAGGYLVLGNNADVATNGGVNVDYQYAVGFFLGNSIDEIVLLDTGLNEIDRVEYDNGATFPDPNGASMALLEPSLDNNVGANWYTSSTPYGDGDLGTPGAANDFPNNPPSATTGAATAVGTSSATLNGIVNANGSSTTVTFEYGTDISYGNAVTADQSPVTGSTDTAVSAILSGLTPNTTYHYRVVATNAGGTTSGADMTFTTEPIKPASGKAYGKDHAPGQNKEPSEPADGKGDAPGQNKEPGEPASGKAYGKDRAPGQNKEPGEPADGKGDAPGQNK